MGLKYAFLLMGDGLDPAVHQAHFANECNDVSVYGVDNIELACAKARELIDEGVELIELCGAFHTAFTKQVIAAVGGKIPIGNVTHLDSEDEKFIKLFGKQEK